MNKNELISAVAIKADMTKKDTEKMLRAFEDVVVEELVGGGKVQMVGFGTFDVTVRAAREGRNPHTKEAIQIAESRAPRFKVGKAFKDAVNNRN